MADLSASWILLLILGSYQIGTINADIPTNAFAIDLYLALRNESANIVVSPLSMQVLLAMAHQGGSGPTAQEIAKVLHIQGENEMVLEEYKKLLTDLQEDPVLKFATKMFIEKNVYVYPEYQSLMQSYFLSEVEGEDFLNSPEASRLGINEWAEKSTDNKIKDLLLKEDVTKDTKLVLANPIHFKANWMNEFPKGDTKDEPFFVSPQNKVNVKMMRITDKQFPYRYSSSLGAQIVELPYKANELKMIIILPNEMDGLSSVESKLVNINIFEELKRERNRLLNLYIPRFKIENTVNMNSILQKLGMITAFSDNAVFHKISNTTLNISKAIQKASIEVNEEGTEAAAASVGSFRSSHSLPPTVRCDHPFIYLISRGKTVLFIGRLTEP